MTTMKKKTYSELITLHTFEERYRYLKLEGNVGTDTFGFDRYLNQQFYKSQEWRNIRSLIIVRDNGCDLGIPDREIHGPICIHHMNPISPDSIKQSSDDLLNPDNLICVSLETHNAIHYGDDSILRRNSIIERTPNDTCPWKIGGDQHGR